MTLVKDLFSEPRNEYRGMPFWAWNAKLSTDLLRQEIRAMKEAKMGGFFMHSRVGLGTAYLKDDFMECVRACIDEARSLDMEAWLYDEDRWPSGSAGGMVTKEIKYRKKFCFWETLRSRNEASSTGKTIAWFAVKLLEPERISKYRRLNDSNESCQADELLVRFYIDTQAPSSWYNGQTYIDPFSKEAVERFIAVTHERYWELFGEEFGKTVPGIFSDEPNWDVQHRLPWTDEMEKKFSDAFGYDLLEHLPELIYYVDGRSFSTARRDYRELLAGMFAKNYAATIGSWCEKHNLRWTGHVLYEDTLTLQTLASAPMRFYEYMQQPGMDLLTEHWNIFNTAIQCASVAHQLGKKRVLSETYGCTGWDFSLAGHKALGDWQYALGVNFRCHHLYWYTMEGQAKRDFPASVGAQSPWFPIYPVVEDYFARLGSILSNAESRNSLLVIHPLESMWGIFVFPQPPAGMDDITEIEVWRRAHIPQVVDEFDQKFCELTNRLLEEKLLFDFGDEEMLSRLSQVRNDRLAVGEAVYDSVLVPELYTIRKSTLDLLEKFHSAGGRVVYLGKAPVFLDGKSSDIPQKVFANFIQADNAALSETLSPAITITDASGKNCKPVICNSGRLSDGSITLFAVNMGMQFDREFNAPRVVERDLVFPDVDIQVAIPASGDVYELFADTGEIVRIPSTYSHGKYHIKSSFGKLQSRLFIFSMEDISTADCPRPENLSTQVALKLTATKALEPNVLVLDHADCRIDNELAAKNEYILSIDSLLRKRLGTPPRGEAMTQPYMQELDASPEKLHVALDYIFEVTDLPKSGCMLALEKPELFSIKLNQVEIEAADKGYWVDQAIRLIDIPAEAFCRGTNHLRLELDYQSLQPGLEMIYILGEFGVKNNCLVSYPDKLEAGDWVTQGFPYYAGNMDYFFELEKNSPAAQIEVEEFGGCAIGFTFDDGIEKVVAWPPYKTVVPQDAKLLKIRVYGHRRNAFGPFYSTGKWMDWSGPGQFLDLLTDERQLVPCGIFRVYELKN